MGNPRTLSLYFRLFNTIGSKQMFHIMFANDWIRTADIWCQKQLLYQLSHNHCPLLAAVRMLCLPSPRWPKNCKIFFFDFSDAPLKTSSSLSTKRRSICLTSSSVSASSAIQTSITSKKSKLFHSISEVGQHLRRSSSLFSNDEFEWYRFGVIS